MGRALAGSITNGPTRSTIRSRIKPAISQKWATISLGSESTESDPNGQRKETAGHRQQHAHIRQGAGVRISVTPDNSQQSLHRFRRRIDLSDRDGGDRGTWLA